jgi:hypothetical protein
MDPQKPNTVICDCCDLDVPERLTSAVRDAQLLIRGARCRKCNEHQGNPLKMAQDHEDEVRIRWGQTCDELQATEDRASDYKERMLGALKSRDGVVRLFEKLGRYHRATDDDGCICGKHNCETLRIIDDDWVNGHIDRMVRRDASG